MLKRLGTTNGATTSTNITTLAAEMLGIKKKNVALNLLLLSLNDKGIHCEVTPNLTDSLCNGNFVPKTAFGPAAFSPFSCAPSLSGTRLENLNVFMILKKHQDGEDLTAKEKEALYTANFIIVTSATQLTKNLDIFAGIVEVYHGETALISDFIRQCHTFA